MLERVDFSAKSPTKEEYKAQRDALMKRLILLQQEAREAQVGLVALFEGWNGAGKGSRISDMIYLMDARSTSVVLTTDQNKNDNELFADLDTGVRGYSPLMKEFWQGLGERGTVTFYERGWYTSAAQNMLQTEHEIWKRQARSKASNPRIPYSKLLENAQRPLEEFSGLSAMDICMESIESFERSLTENGYVVVKFFVHITKKAQRKRLEALFSDPDTRWRVSDEEILRISDYDDLYELQDTLLERSDYDFAPWHVLNGEDKRGANLEIAQTIVDELERAIAAKKEKAAQPKVYEGPAPTLSRFPIMTDYPVLDDVDHGLALSLDDYKSQLKREQKRLFKLELEMYQQRVPLMIMYEGWDAAGKGGSIKRVAQALDARAYTIFPSPAPTKQELAHPHLWRYWTRLPKAGHVGIYDRSWYGRVLVERLENIATHEEWSRAYDEINEFERDMVDWGAILLKFWVDITEDEQLKRFEERQDDPMKQWKITEEDWRNRDKNPQYREAVQDMFRLTSTTFAPWYILESDNKQYARVKALKIINDTLEQRLL